MLYGVFLGSHSSSDTIRLNPYFFGKCSTAPEGLPKEGGIQEVLILIFLENALRRPRSIEFCIGAELS